MSEKLDINKLEEISKDFDDLVEKRINVKNPNNGETSTVTIEVYEKFSNFRMAQCVNEYMKNLNKFSKFGVSEEDEYFYQLYFVFNLIKHFTTLDIPNSLNKQISVLENMINTGILLSIFALFDENEIKRITKKLNEAVDELEIHLDEFSNAYEMGDQLFYGSD